MKLKYYLRGIGIGLIITTIVMALTFMLHKDDLISDDEVRERARALGMVMQEEAGGRDTLLNNDGMQPNASQGEKNDVGSGADALSASAQQEGDDAGRTGDEKEAADKRAAGQEASDQEASDKKDRKTDDKNEPTVDVGEEVELSIVGGEYSDIVSQKLFKAGLIDDAEAFNKYLAKGGYDNLIQPGTYTIPVGSNYKTIVSIITEKDKENKED